MSWGTHDRDGNITDFLDRRNGSKVVANSFELTNCAASVIPRSQRFAADLRGAEGPFLNA